jgi:hypothetical protein
MPIPENSQVIGFQLSVYALADALKPACTIDSFRLGVNDGNAADFLWRQFVVTDNDARVRRYVYRNATTRLTPDYRLSAASLDTAPYLSLVMTHNHQNGTCWVDCIELQLLYTVNKLTLPPGETTAAAENATSSSTKEPVTTATVFSESLMVLDEQEGTVPMSVVIGLAIALGVVLLLLIVTIAIAVHFWRLHSQSKSGFAPAPAQAQQAAAGAGAPAIYQSHGLSTRYEMLELAAPPGQTNYIPGTALMNDA